MALEYWKVAGGWMQEERAEYRLAMSLLKAGNPLKAKVHADRCEAICRQNGEDAFELFYAHDLLDAGALSLKPSEQAKTDGR